MFKLIISHQRPWSRYWDSEQSGLKKKEKRIVSL